MGLFINFGHNPLDDIQWRVLRGVANPIAVLNVRHPEDVESILGNNADEVTAILVHIVPVDTILSIQGVASQHGAPVWCWDDMKRKYVDL